jgi:hypothetical protein
VGNQGSRWGSCTPVDRTIRLSDRLQGMPGWVLDYVLVHELVHLRVPGHGADFWAEVEQFPRTERARGYLEGVSATAGLGFSDADESGADEGDATAIGENVEIIAPAADIGRGKRPATRPSRGTRPSKSRQRPEQGALDFDMFDGVDSGDIGDSDEVDAKDRA